MKMLRKMNHELLNCTACLWRYIKWMWFFPLTILSGLIYGFLTAGYIAEADTMKEALTYYLSCPSNGNLLYVLAFYFVTFLPVIFALRFFDYKICEEYYSIRLSNKKVLVLSKVLCVIGLNFVNILLRIGLFTLCSTLLLDNISIQLRDLAETFLFLLIPYVTLDLIVFLLYSFTKNAIVLFTLFSVLFLFSLQFDSLNDFVFLFWIYALNYQNLTVYVLCGDLLLLIWVVGALLLRHYDIIPKEEEKNE